MRYARLAAAALPLLGLGALWAIGDRTYNSGTEWEVPIQGYDPRDYLRGHYVEFSYDWPGYDEARDGALTGLCLAGEPPRLHEATRLVEGRLVEGQPCPHPVRVDEAGVYRMNGLVTGRLYIGQARAAQLQEQLRNRDQRGIVTIRQRGDGSFTPVAIRFRPLTPAEIAERDAPAGAAPLSPFDPLGAPAVMEK
ncbi:GDYXXLXY domain-containing protein [Porphyrobacter sp. AAP82]|uniref:GDYXXLXY domain-containing protein n=1 Tax=Porphyrobacter sp. AAP82 TaxID=1248917 RepID=UPI000317F2C1|nr:GDYXXLXY domain-containing protein [Porphyrobacter sp. AAP82]